MIKFVTSADGMTWVTVVLLVLLLLLVVLLLLQPQRGSLPPGPRGLPLVGNLFDLLKYDPIEYFTMLSKEHGPIYSVQMGLRPVVVLHSRYWMQEAFVKHADTFTDRPHGTVLHFIAGGKGRTPKGGVVMSEGSTWRDSRKLLTQVLKEFGMGSSKIEDYIALELNEFMESLKKDVGKPLEIHPGLATSVLNIVWHMFAGEHFEVGDPFLRWMVTSIERTANLINQGGFLNFVPFVQFIGTFLRLRAFQVLWSLIYRMLYFNKIIHQHRQQLHDPTRSLDLVYAFLQEQEKLKKTNQPAGIYTDSQLRWLLSDLFVAGLDTSVSAMRWAFLFIVKHPTVASKLSAEIVEVVGRERKPCLSDRNRMPYMEAFISETLRYAAVVPLISHAPSQDTTLGPYHVPAGTMIITNLYGALHDPEVWESPEEFRPQRFLTADGRVKKDDNLIPFSVGRRSCLGESLARAEIFLFLATILQTFEVLPGCHPLPPMDYVHGLFLHPKPFKVKLELRELNRRNTGPEKA
ncbi:Cytochrome P450 [Trinorchestia longiramus]|nr:Cytochrome P450 [Trinorchestia longiramus]